MQKGVWLIARTPLFRFSFNRHILCDRAPMNYRLVLLFFFFKSKILSAYRGCIRMHSSSSSSPGHEAAAYFKLLFSLRDWVYRSYPSRRRRNFQRTLAMARFKFSLTFAVHPAWLLFNSPDIARTLEKLLFRWLMGKLATSPSQWTNKVDSRLKYTIDCTLLHSAQW